MNDDAVQDHYPEDFSHCYGCGRLNPRGLKLKSVPSGDEVVARFTPDSHQAAVPGFVYGGLIASLADCHGMATASAFALAREGRRVGEAESPRYVTASLHVSYLRPTPLDGELVLRARVSEAGARKIVVAVSVAAGEQETVRAEVVAVPIPAAMLRRSNSSH